MQTEAGIPCRSEDPDATDRQRLYDVIIRFRLRPMRHPVGQPTAGGCGARRAPAAHPADRVLPGDDALDRAGRGVVVIDAIGRVLFLNRTAEWMLERVTDIEVTQGGFLRLADRSLQARFARYLVDSRRADRREPGVTERSDSLSFSFEIGTRGGANQLVVTPLFEPPLARLVRRSAPLHAVFVYETPSRMALP